MLFSALANVLYAQPAMDESYVPYSSVRTSLVSFREELKLTPAQLQLLEGAMRILVMSGAKTDAEMAAAFRKREEAVRAINDKVLASLTPAQLRRVNEIEIQQAQLMAVRLPRVKRELALTVDQDLRLGRAVKEIFGPLNLNSDPSPMAAINDTSKPVAERLAAVEKARAQDRRRREAWEEATRRYEQVVDAVLTSSQRKHLQQMAGEPYLWAGNGLEYWDVRLLRVRRVQELLGMSLKESNDFSELERKLSLRPGGGGELSSAANATLLASIKPKMRARLRELTFQFRGIRAVTESVDLAKRLGIATPSLRTLMAKLNAVQQDASFDLWAANLRETGSVNGVPRQQFGGLANVMRQQESAMKWQEDTRQKEQEVGLPLLTPAQRKKWQQMQGKIEPQLLQWVYKSG